MSAAALLEPRPRAPRALAPRDVVRTLGLAFHASAWGMSAESAMQSLGSEEAAGVTRTLLNALGRAMQQPAVTTTPEWAGVLAEPTMAAFLSLVEDEASMALALPVVRYPYDGKSLKIPQRLPGAASDLAGMWHLEAAPIRVAGLSLSAGSLLPRYLGVLSAATVEMVRAAGPQVLEQVIRQGAITDTAKVLDATFFGDAAGTVAQPPGIGYALASADTATSSGNTAAAIASDLRERLTAMVAAGFGNPRSTRWVMSSLNAAVLLEHFAEMQTKGTMLGYEVQAGPYAPTDVVYLVDGRGLAMTADVPNFDTSGEVTLHMEADAALVSPISSSSGEPPVTEMATPVRSFFQTRCIAYRLIWPIGWSTPVTGSVQALTDVQWATA